MSRARAAPRIYTVVEVISGVATGVQSFQYRKRALRCLLWMREGRNLQEGDIQLFGSKIDCYEGKKACGDRSCRYRSGS